MGRKLIYETGADKFRAYRARKKENTLTLIEHYGVSADLFLNTDTGIRPRPGVELTALPDGAYWVGNPSHGVAVKRGDAVLWRRGLEIAALDPATATPYIGIAQQLSRMPGYLQRFYTGGETE